MSQEIKIPNLCLCSWICYLAWFTEHTNGHIIREATNLHHAQCLSR
jgi:hypothetical protein